MTALELIGLIIIGCTFIGIVGYILIYTLWMYIDILAEEAEELDE